MLPKLILSLGVLAFAAMPCRAATVYSNLAQKQNYLFGSGRRWDDVSIAGGGRMKLFRFHGHNSGPNNPNQISANVTVHLFDQANNRPNGAQLGAFQVASTVQYRIGEGGVLGSNDLRPLNIILPDNAELGVSITLGQYIYAYKQATIGSSADILWYGSPPTPQLTSNIIDSLGIEIETSPASDFNFDDVVNVEDLQAWSASFGSSAADADGDGDSDGADFLTWQRQVGSIATLESTVVVPEPEAMALVAAMIMVFGSARRAHIRSDA